MAIPEATFHGAGRGEWKTTEQNGLTAHYAGREASVIRLLDALSFGAQPDAKELGALLRGLPGHFAVFIQGGGWWIAAADTVRGYQLFHAEGPDGALHFSGCARTARDAAGLSGTDSEALTEFFMAGYVSGNRTLVPGLSQLQAGEALLAGANGVESLRYYLFHSLDFFDESEDGLIEGLGHATDAVFDRLVEDLDGRPVWLPLSAGLDSRLVAAKLVERDYPRIETFSYGVPGNHEADHAAKVAKALDLPWRFVPTTGSAMRAFHESETRREYWKFCDGLCSVPNPQDIVPLLALREEGALPDDAVLVNGQSGDFSCGAHIPEPLTKPGASLEMLVDGAVAKHFALWRDLVTPDNAARIGAGMREVLGALAPSPETPMELAVLHDCWEWQERQSKYVVNGQRSYDFLGLDWRLPLWEREWQEFWPRVPVPHRLRRGLHKKYLRTWDYRGLFSGREPVVGHWPGGAAIFFVLAQGIGLFGRRAKDAWYRYVRWFGHYGYQWRSYPAGRFLRDAQQARNVLSQFCETWAQENLGLEGRHHRP